MSSGGILHQGGRGLLAVWVAILVLVSPLASQAAPGDKGLTWAGCGISKKAFMTEMAKAFEKKTGIKIKLQGGGATKGIRKVSAREIDLGGACRQTLVKPNSLAPHSKETRVQMDPVAWDALVVLVHPSNPVKNITLKQLRAIYTGRITNWRQIPGGKNAPIELYVRKGKISGVGRTIRELIFYDYEKVFKSPGMITVKSSGPLEKAMQVQPNAIGISGISSARKRLPKLKILQLEGKAPTYGNIKNGEYLLYRPLFLVVNLHDLNNPLIIKFSQFVHSEEGRAVMRKVGTVPYADAMSLWLKYLQSVRKAQERGLKIR